MTSSTAPSTAMVRAAADADAVIAPHTAPTPRPGEVTVALRAAGLCFVEDALLDGRRRRGTFPRVLGHEGAGVVAAVGADVHDIEVGDRVVLLPRSGCGECSACVRSKGSLCRAPGILGQDLDGCWSDDVTLDRSWLLHIPPQVPMSVAAVAACAGTSALRAAAAAVTEPVDTVVVRGIGTGIGCYAALIARALGSRRVVGVARTDRHAAALRELGIETVVADGDDPIASIRKVIGADGADALIDAVADWRGQDYTRVVARGGRVVFVGDIAGVPVSLNPSLLIYRNQSVLSADLGGAADVGSLLDLIASGAVSLPVTEHAGGVATLAQLLREPHRRHAHPGRDVCVWPSA